MKGRAMMNKRPSILAVDDEQIVLKLLERTLKAEGYGVITADNGKAALELLEEHSPDLVMLDIMMPGIDGFQLLRIIRQRSSVPIIMLSASGELSNVRDALELGADDYVRKPFGKNELLARIKAKLRRSAAIAIPN